MFGALALVVALALFGTRRLLRGRRRRTQWIAWGVVASVVAIVAVSVVLIVVPFSGSDLSAVSPPTLMQRSTSPDGRWTVRVWDHDPGAMAPEFYSADLVDNWHQRATRQVLELIDSGDAAWTNDGNHLRIRWLSRSVVSIGGHKIDVLTGQWSDAGVDFTSAAFRFSISYDPNALSGAVDKDASAITSWDIPGAGHVSGPSLVYVLRLPASLGNGSGGVLEVTAVKDPRLRSPSLSQFSQEPYLRRLETHDWIGDPPKAVTLDGIPALSYTGQCTGGPLNGLTMLAYVIYKGGFVYYLNLAARTESWGAVMPTLDDVAQSFRVIQ